MEKKKMLQVGNINLLFGLDRVSTPRLMDRVPGSDLCNDA